MNDNNPYYSPEKLNLEMLVLDQPDMCYEYNTLCFWATEKGQVYCAADSGCSCPTPFEEYSGRNQQEVLKLLERIGSVGQAAQTIESWGGRFLQSHEIDAAVDWVKSKLK